jgi:AraC-like DNA-binding protein
MKESLALTEMEHNINNIRCVVRQDIHKGYIYYKDTGRHSDCFVYIIQGTTQYRFKQGYDFVVKDGDILFLAKGSIYFMNILSDIYEFIFVDFDFDISDTIELRSCRTSMQHQPGIEKMFSNLIDKWTAKRTAYKLECKAVLYEIYAQIMHASETAYAPHYKHKLIEEAMNFILSQYTRSIKVSDLADMSDMSEVHFRRVFKEINKISPKKYITHLRIKRAKELLQYRDMKITDIARELGFSSSYYFCNVFKKETGRTPTEYRYKLGTNYTF